MSDLPKFEPHPVQRPGTRVHEVLRPKTAEEAVRFAATYPKARPMAGGTDLLLELQRTPAGFEDQGIRLIDLSFVPEFRSIVDDEHEFILGACVTHNQVVGDPWMRTSVLPLAQACLEIGSPQLRNRASLVGNVVTASPANDTISALMALGASVDVSHLGKIRNVMVSDFFAGFRQTVLQRGELVTRLRVPKLKSNQRGIWFKLGLRKAQAISVVHGAIVVTLDDSDRVQAARLALGSVAPTVVLVPEFAGALTARALTEETIAAAAAATVNAVEPIDDGRATAAYRSASIVPLISRALRALATGDEASMWPNSPPLLTSLRTPGTLRAPSVKLNAQKAVRIRVNGRIDSLKDATDLTLLEALRDHIPAPDVGSLSGVKEGCAEGECGACTVLMNDAAVMSCLVHVSQADGHPVRTIEGLAGSAALHPVQEAFVQEFAVQCGFCIPGFVMAATRLIEENPDPSDEQIKLALSGNLCRCTGYYPIIQAVKTAAAVMRGQSRASTPGEEASDDDVRFLS